MSQVRCGAVFHWRQGLLFTRLWARCTRPPRHGGEHACLITGLGTSATLTWEDPA